MAARYALRREGGARLPFDPAKTTAEQAPDWEPAAPPSLQHVAAMASTPQVATPAAQTRFGSSGSTAIVLQCQPIGTVLLCRCPSEQRKSVALDGFSRISEPTDWPSRDCCLVQVSGSPSCSER